MSAAPALPTSTHHAITLQWKDPVAKLVGLPVLPTLNVGDTIAFSGVGGHKARVKFLSPTGDPLLTLEDGQLATLKVGGIYQFQCIIDDVVAVDGGGVEIIPHKP